jgi:hypothetical protein
LPKICADIKQEIKDSCPSLITDGSRPFRAQFREISKFYLEVVVDARFTQRPACRAYFELKEVVLAAIMRACEQNDVTFACETVQNASVLFD